MHVGDAEEAEDGLQVRRLRVGFGPAILAAPREGDVGLLAFEQAFRSVLGVTEGDASAGNGVQP